MNRSVYFNSLRHPDLSGNGMSPPLNQAKKLGQKNSAGLKSFCPPILLPNRRASCKISDLTASRKRTLRRHSRGWHEASGAGAAAV